MLYNISSIVGFVIIPAMSNIEKGCKKQFKLQELSDTLNNIDLFILYILSLSFHLSLLIITIYLMKIGIAILIISYFYIINTITTQCSDNSNCPTNSICSGTFCECSGPYILDCQTQANYLT